MKPLNKVLLIFLAVLLFALIPATFCRFGVTDPFIFLQLSTVERVVKEGSFSNPAAADPLYTPAFTSIMAILGLALGIPVWYLQFLPIHGVVLPLVYYVMCKRLTQSFWLAMAATSVMVISVGTGSAFYSTWVHGWGFVLFPLFVWAYFRFLGTPSPKMLGLMVVFLISAFLYSYTVDVWIVTFSLVLAVSPILSRNWKAARAGSSFGLAALAITLYFNRVIYDAYLAAKRFTAVDSPSEFLAKYFPGLIPRGNNPYQYVVSDIWFNVSSIALIGALCAISVALLLYDLRCKGRAIFWRAETRIAFALIVSAPVDMVIYATAGVVTPRFILFMFPAVIGILLSYLRGEPDSASEAKPSTSGPRYLARLTAVAFALLMVSGGSTLIARWTTVGLTHSLDYYHEYDPVSDWVAAHADGHAFTADLISGFKIVFDSSEDGRPIAFHPINVSVYSGIVRFQNGSYNEQLAVLSWNLSRIDGENWLQFKPWEDYRPDILSNPAWNVVYADGVSSVIVHSP